MPILTVLSKGQITLPKKIRMAMGLHPGDRVDFVLTTDGCCSLVPLRSSLRGLKGCIAASATPISLNALRLAARRRAVRAKRAQMSD
jgi:antitoxin PrlF